MHLLPVYGAVWRWILLSPPWKCIEFRGGSPSTLQRYFGKRVCVCVLFLSVWCFFVIPVMFVVFFGARVAKWGPGPKNEEHRRQFCKRTSPILAYFSDVFSKQIRSYLSMPSTRHSRPILGGCGWYFGSLWKTFSSTNQQTSILAGGKGSGCSENPSHEILGGRFLALGGS